jgi:hypothetical protein
VCGSSGVSAIDWSRKIAELDDSSLFRLNLRYSPKRWRGEGRAGNVSTFTVQPGARMLWCLRRRTTDVRCIMYPNGMPVEVQVVQDRDIVLTELFQEEWLALNWARAYCARLKQQGWQDSPSQVKAEPQAGS